jgi:nucleotide-binding universal stress UspA family protein
MKDPAVDVPGGVVVGHDGSGSSDRALAFAAEEARLRGLPLHVVRAWSMTSTQRPKGVPHGVVASEDEYTAAVTAELTAAVGRVLGADVGLDVRLHVVHAGSAAALVSAAKRADLLVVASRGRGGFSDLLVGSTSEQVVRHADCPVVVIRG